MMSIVDEQDAPQDHVSSVTLSVRRFIGIWVLLDRPYHSIFFV
jgi:hypothetical protein